MWTAKTVRRPLGRLPPYGSKSDNCCRSEPQCYCACLCQTWVEPPGRSGVCSEIGTLSLVLNNPNGSGSMEARLPPIPQPVALANLIQCFTGAFEDGSTTLYDQLFYLSITCVLGTQRNPQHRWHCYSKSLNQTSNA